MELKVPHLCTVLCWIGESFAKLPGILCSDFSIILTSWGFACLRTWQELLSVCAWALSSWSTEESFKLRLINTSTISEWLCFFLTLKNADICKVFFQRNKVCLYFFSFKWRSHYLIWKLRCSFNLWNLDECFYVQIIATRWRKSG